jgi:ketosteroid isomerase-like protein
MPIKTLWFKLIFTFILIGFSITKAQQKEIKQVLINQINAWNHGDLQGYMQGYWKNDSLVFVGSRGLTYGWQNTLDNYKKSYPTTEKMGILEFSDLQVKRLNKKSALVYGKWKLIRKEDTPGGIFSLVFQKINQEWKIISDHTQ